MRVIIRLILFLLLMAGTAGQLYAQSQCSQVAANQMIRDFSQWDWAVQPAHQDYCRTWAIQRVNGSIVSVGAPWIRSQGNDAFREMDYDKDYTRQKGWELLRIDFGARTPIQIPYFILYNKYNGVIRAFFYVDNSQGTYLGGALISMTTTKGSGNVFPATTSLAGSLLQSSDKYLQGSAGSEEIMTYVAKVSLASWVMGEFNVGYDPQIGSTAYAGSTLKFELQGITNNQVNLQGSLNWKTDAQEGYGVVGKTSDVVKSIQAPTTNDPRTGIRNFVASGQKVLGKLPKKDIEKFLQDAAGKAEKAKELFAVGSNASARKLQRANQLIKLVGEGSRLPGTIKKILDIAGGVNMAFGVLGSVIGTLWPSEDSSAPQAPAFIPTVSTGTLALTGVITTTYPLTGVFIQVPGSQHRGDGGTKPYYDCGLGLFALKNTPILNKRVWGSGNISNFTWGACYQIGNDVIPSFNRAAGLKLVSAQAAIVTEDTLQSSSRLALETLTDGDIVSAESISANTTKVVYQTPFVDLSCFKNLVFNTSVVSYNRFFNNNNEKIFVRVKAVLQRTDAMDSPPIFFVQDYAVQLVPNAPATNPAYNPTSTYLGLPFSNFAVPANATYRYQATIGVNSTPVLNIGGITGDNFAFPYPAVTIGGQTFPGTAPGAVMIFDHPQTSNPSAILAEEGVYFGEGVSVTPGTNFIASTSYLAYRDYLQCGPVVIDPAVVPCSYNSDANRVSDTDFPPDTPFEGAKDAEAQLIIYPNPSLGDIAVTTGLVGKGASLTVYDSFGRLVKTISHLPTGKRVHNVSLAGQAPGIYIVRLQLGGKALSRKIILQ